MPEIRVKPLEWVKHPTVDLWRAETILGTYHVYAIKPPFQWQFDGYDGVLKETGESDDMEAAKSAAYADLKARVLPLLETPTS